MQTQKPSQNPLFESAVSRLKTIPYPGAAKPGSNSKLDLIQSNSVRDLKVFDDGKVELTLALDDQAKAFEAALMAVIDKSLTSIEGIKSVKVNVQSTPGGKTTPLPGIQNVIAVSSGKGGVGKSTVSVNLATALATQGFSVGLLDADIYGPNIPTMMGVTENPRLIKDPIKGESFIPPVSHKVKVMSMGFLIEGDQPVIWRGPMLHNILSQFTNKVEWGELDFLIIDLPPGTGDVQLSLAQLIPLSGAVIVTTPQEVALQDVRKAMNMWDKVKVPVIGVVENMSFFTGDDGKKYYIFGQGGGEMLAKKFNTELLEQLPLLPAVREGGDEGKPIVLKAPETENAKALQSLAKKVALKVNSNSKSTSPQIEIGKF